MKNNINIYDIILYNYGQLSTRGKIFLKETPGIPELNKYFKIQGKIILRDREKIRNKIEDYFLSISENTTLMRYYLSELAKTYRITFSGILDYHLKIKETFGIYDNIVSLPIETLEIVESYRDIIEQQILENINYESR